MYTITNQLEKIGFSITLVSDIIKRNNYSNKFNTSNFYNIYLVSEDLELTVGQINYNIKGGNAVFIGPQKDVEFGDAYRKEIYVIAFSSDFYDRSSKDSLFLNSQVFYNFQSEIFIAPYFGNTDYNKIILVERLSKFKDKDESLYISAVHNAIEALILDAYLHVEEHHSENDERLMFVSNVNRFKILLQRDFKTAKKVSYYADELRLSARRLTEMTEYVYGKSAKQIIIDKIKLECEKAIKYSDMTISEISYDMGFSDEGNFSNFIKKHTGKKPSELRVVTI
ncbi:helix-turn-helix domain-containing protein [Chryseobacterium chendengshani]|uniref:helix-turn-helix domain-containing protein n=1 Tax=unclassified Chryseobacterium TaxID=2593645 RepID=UPI001C63BD7C|nr:MULTISPECIES: helix-turn-helix domain-containing protein [unclassified Chryseobacterium]MBW7674312.1 helix-turn-helix domain-containing protein [Chryseobacterium sp. LJ756]MBW8522898.1 helix-turn-helix domain-containing protein [Chryseobacterium sp. LJ668]QYK16427.1 helix-turn-helix domain-containing protein [Chryseobacterium sp. LJ668]